MPYKNPEVRREKQKGYNRTWRAKQPEGWRRTMPSYGKTYSVPTTEASRAHAKVRRLERPTTCSRCGAEGFIEAAHFDYQEPEVVSWLCRPCHRREDANLPKGGNRPVPEVRKLPPALRTHCPQGHPYDGENVIREGGGARRCRICRMEQRVRARERSTS